MKTDELKKQIAAARSRYYQLVLLVGSAAAGKTKILAQIAQEEGYPYINLSLVLSQKLLEYPAKRQALRLPRMVETILGEAEKGIVLLDNTEILFEPVLEQDPLRLLQQASRNRTIVATWSGKFEGGALVYAEPGHPEYRKCYEIDALICPLE